LPEAAAGRNRGGTLPPHVDDARRCCATSTSNRLLHAEVGGAARINSIGAAAGPLLAASPTTPLQPMCV
jgi:hypothetical protein